jgi:hypothetical protein
MKKVEERLTRIEQALERLEARDAAAPGSE